MFIKDAIVEGSGNFDHVEFFNVHLNDKSNHTSLKHFQIQRTECVRALKKYCVLLRVRIHYPMHACQKMLAFRTHASTTLTASYKLKSNWREKVAEDS